MNRRQSLSAGLGMLAGALALPQLAQAEGSPPGNGDAELIRLGQQLDRAQQAIEAFEQGPEPADADAALAVVMAPAYAAVGRIEELRATTLAGLMVQARAVDWCRSGEPCDPGTFGPTTDARLAAAIVRGLLGMQRAAMPADLAGQGGVA